MMTSCVNSAVADHKTVNNIIEVPIFVCYAPPVTSDIMPPSFCLCWFCLYMYPIDWIQDLHIDSIPYLIINGVHVTLLA